MRNKNFSCVFVLFLAIVLVACGTKSEEYQPKNGQPNFPPLGKYWVIDNGCDFNPETIKYADETFEKLRLDGIAEVVVICQKGIKNRGSSNDDKIWARDWGRWAKLGDKEDQRAIVWLIRPDVKPEDHRVTIEISQWLYWYTAIDYRETLEEAANYANWDDFNGALESISRNTDSKLRELWTKQQKGEGR